MASPLPEVRPQSRKATLGKLAELLENQGIDLDEIGRINRVNAWQGFYKDAEGAAQTVDMVGVQFTPKWNDGPLWPVLQPAPRVRLPSRKGAVGGTVLQSAVVLPDMQIGYFRLEDNDLTPTHDEAAIAVALDLVRAAKPARVILVGDNLDLPELGRYRTSPAFQRTMQAAIDRAGLLCAQLRDAAPAAEIVWIAGNHEERLPRWILDNAVAAFGLRRANTPDSWPVLSVPFLCNMDDYAVDYRAGYPASDYWINHRLRVIHGSLAKSGASTASAYLDREKSSVIFGHTHRLEWAERTRRDHDGPRRILAMSPGCLARIDGAVPSTKQGLDLDGRPLVSHEDWQQGIAIITHEEGDGAFWPELIPIHDGRAFWRGKEYLA